MVTLLSWLVSLLIDHKMNNVHFLTKPQLRAIVKKKLNDVHFSEMGALMAGLQKAKREEATRKLLEAAVACVEEGGIDALHARELARRSGYSVGSVYKYYEDLDAMISAVNSVTLSQIGQAVGQAIADKPDPMDRLKALAHAYLDYASANENLWKALFGHRLPDGRSIPEDHREANVALLSLIGNALLEINPTLDDETLQARTRSCFAAVHGIVIIALERRFVGLSGERLDSEMDFLVERLARQEKD